MESLLVDRRRCGIGSRLRAEHAGSTVEELRLPRRDLVRMDVVLLSQFGERLLAPDGSQATFALKAGVWFRRVRLDIFFPVRQAILAAHRRKDHSTDLFRFPKPDLPKASRKIGVVQDRLKYIILVTRFDSHSLSHHSLGQLVKYRTERRDCFYIHFLVLSNVWRLG